MIDNLVGSHDIYIYIMLFLILQIYSRLLSEIFLNLPRLKYSVKCGQNIDLEPILHVMSNKDDRKSLYKQLI